MCVFNLWLNLAYSKTVVKINYVFYVAMCQTGLLAWIFLKFPSGKKHSVVAFHAVHVGCASPVCVPYTVCCSG